MKLVLTNMVFYLVEHFCKMVRAYGFHFSGMSAFVIGPTVIGVQTEIKSFWLSLYLAFFGFGCSLWS